MTWFLPRINLFPTHWLDVSFPVIFIIRFHPIIYMCSLLLFEVLELVDEAALENILKSVAKNISEDNLRFAELDLKTAKGMAPEDPRVWYYDGVVKARSDRYTEALESLDKAVDLGMTDDADVYFHKGYCLWKLKNPDGAVENLEKALELDPSKEMAYYLAVLVYGQKGNLDKAEEYTNILLELNPEKKDYRILKDQIQQMK